MSVGNSSFFTRPVAAAMFPIAPVVFSATVKSHITKYIIHTHTQAQCNITSSDSADKLSVHMIFSPLSQVIVEHNDHSHLAPLPFHYNEFATFQVEVLCHCQKTKLFTATVMMLMFNKQVNTHLFPRCLWPCYLDWQKKKRVIEIHVFFLQRRVILHVKISFVCR